MILKTTLISHENGQWPRVYVDHLIGQVGKTSVLNNNDGEVTCEVTGCVDEVFAAITADTNVTVVEL